jgi:hypothetical protein
MKPLAFAVLASCANGGMFVQDVHVDHFDLVVTRCWVSVEADRLQVSDCKAERQRLPVIVDRPAPAVVPARDIAPERSATLVQDELARGIAAVKPALLECSTRGHLAQAIKLHVAIADTGKAAEVTADDPAFAACATTAFDAIAFPPTRDGTAFSFTFDPRAPGAS